eukprot:7614595-Pyramimonas_sp.AAC.1
MQQSFQFFRNKQDFDWSQARGPAGAVVLTLRRIALEPRAWMLFVTDSGLEIDLEYLGGHSLKMVLE